MVSRTGAQLIDDQAIATLKQQLLPIAQIITPNRYEAQILADIKIHTLEDMQKSAEIIYRLGARAVLVKGGSMPGDLRGVDVYFDGETCTTLRTEMVHTQHTHGTGCTLAAAIAANLALGKPLSQATHLGKNYVTTALKHALAIGKGQGPVGHYYPLLGMQARV
jgi:hydroxymethylpyrimidine/phosphomethylpyrimidine kinase